MPNKLNEHNSQNSQPKKRRPDAKRHPSDKIRRPRRPSAPKRRPSSTPGAPSTRRNLLHQAGKTRERVVKLTRQREPRQASSKTSTNRSVQRAPRTQEQVLIITSSKSPLDIIKENQLNGNAAVFVRGICNILLASETIVPLTENRFAADMRDKALKKGYRWTSETMKRLIKPSSKRPAASTNLSRIVFIPTSQLYNHSRTRDAINELVHSVKDLQQEEVVAALSGQIGPEDLKVLQEISNLLSSGVKNRDAKTHGNSQNTNELQKYEAQLEKAKQYALTIITRLLARPPKHKTPDYWNEIDSEIGKIAMLL